MNVRTKKHFSVDFYQLKKQEGIITYFLDKLELSSSDSAKRTVLERVKMAYPKYDLFFPKQFSIFMKFWKLELHEIFIDGSPHGTYKFIIKKNGKEFYNFLIGY